MYLTPSIIDGILRAFFAFIVHPTDSDAQITTLYYYAFIHGRLLFIIVLPIEYNKTYALFQVFLSGLLICKENQFVEVHT